MPTQMSVYRIGDTIGLWIAFALGMTGLGACSSQVIGGGSERQECAATAVRLTILVDGDRRVLEEAVLVSNRLPNAESGSSSDIQILDSSGQQLASASVPFINPPSIISQNGEGGVAGEMVAQTISVLAPWPSGASQIHLDGTTIQNPTCSVSLGSIKSDSENTTPQLAYTGPSSHRFDIVVLGDGYTSEEQDKFEIDVQRLADAILDLEPYNRYRHLINIWYVPSVSEDSGAGIDGVSINTSYECKYGNHGIHRLLLCDDRKATDAVRAAVPEFDSILMLVNEDDDADYGGSGGDTVAVSYTGRLMPEVLRHEFGHQLGLADEYVYAGFTGASAIAAPNCSPSAGTTPWDVWRDSSDVDAFIGCRAMAHFRPTNSGCLMQDSRNPDYCPVCREHVIKEIHKRASTLIESASPSESSGMIKLPHDFEVSVANPDSGSVQYQWSVDGALQSETSSLHLQSCEDGPLKVTVSEVTPWVRSDPENYLSDAMLWKLDCSETPLPDPEDDDESFSGTNTDRTAIPDDNFIGIQSKIRVDQAEFLASTVEVRIDITHPYRGDLAVFLESPDGTWLSIVDVDSNDDNRDLVGRFQVNVPTGTSAIGDWRLYVIDNQPTDQGHLEEWSIGINQAAP